MTYEFVAGINNASDWAFYSSSRGNGVAQLSVLPSSDPNVLEQVDMTPALLAPGQVQTEQLDWSSSS